MHSSVLNTQAKIYIQSCCANAVLLLMLNCHPLGSCSLPQSHATPYHLQIVGMMTLK